jgi:GNAT superfamily N-acetyltransferase
MDLSTHLSFQPIDVARDGTLCITFREDVFMLALGSTRALHGEDGHGSTRYVNWLQAQKQKLPGSMVHAWAGGEIIGQLEMNQPEPGLGYVHLFYLTEPWRHRGVGQQLHDHALSWFRGQGCKRLALSASRDNLPALRFYQRNGWQDVGLDERAPGVNRFERACP